MRILNTFFNIFSFSNNTNFGKINDLEAFISSKLKVLCIPALRDNYIYMILWKDTAAVVDPSISQPVEALLKRHQLKLTHILCTHHHYDHTGGNRGLKVATQCQVIGPDDKRISGLDLSVKGGDKFHIGPTEFHVLSLPGHTRTHIAYYIREEKILFTGDFLFAGGGGRLIEGTPEEMWTSLCKLMNLPDETIIFCGHEYTLENLEFAMTLEPENQAIKKRLESVKKLRKQNIPSVPSVLAEEKQSNPFLRVNDPMLRRSLGMEEASEVEVFAAIRKLKNSF